MQAQTGNNELNDFVQYATKLLESGMQSSSVEELVRQWRSGQEVAEAVEDIRQGLTDDGAGRAESVDTAFREIRQRLGISREA